MCGIAGSFGTSHARDDLARILRAMTQEMVHRGPDDSGFRVRDGAGFGMRRLAIIDLETGAQPITNEGGSIAVVSNGEIYNYKELRSDLCKRHQFQTLSDTEVIVHLYEELGARCVEHLRGMYAFAVWDEGNDALLIARDRLGIKPLYYARLNDALVFASEIKSLLCHPGIEAAINFEALGHFLSLKYVPAPLTLFQGIHSLPPGHLLHYRRGELREERYWNLSYRDAEPEKRRESEYAEELEEVLGETIRLHLRSDVPFGAFLSGGLDSSAIVALMSEVLEQPVKTFSVGFESRAGESDERPYARMVADRYCTDHREVMITPDDLIEHNESVIWHLDQPLADDASLATYVLAKKASKHVKMILSGEGGDEVFAGYARHSAERLSPWFGRLPVQSRALLLRGAEALPGLRRPKLALNALCQREEASRMLHWFPMLNTDAKSQIISNELWETLRDSASTEDLYRAHLAETNAEQPLHRMLYLDTKLWLPDFLLLRGDKLSMAHSLEARVPFLDHRLVEFVSSLPPNLKMRGLVRKYLLRKVVGPRLPKVIVNRKKKGFPTPLSGWLREESRDYLRDLLSPAAVADRGLWDPKAVARLITEHEDRVADHASTLCGLASVELWQRLFLDVGRHAGESPGVVAAR